MTRAGTRHGHDVPVDRNGLDVLSREEALTLAATAPVGRVAFVVGGIPVVVPVNFVLFQGDVVFRTGTGSKLLAALGRSVVSFEVDGIDRAARSGWSVLITGPSSEITRADERTAVEGTGLESWLPARHRYVRIRSDIVSGRRLHSQRVPVSAPETEWDWSS